MTTYTDGNIFTAANATDLQGRSQDFGGNIIRDYGAVGDGTTDDRVAFQNAFNILAASPRGGGLFVPPGNYLIGTPGIVVPTAIQRSVTFHGVSSGTGGNTSAYEPSRLLRNGAYPILSSKGTGLADNQQAQGLNVHDIWFEGASQTSVVVELERQANSFWNRVAIKNSNSYALTGKQLWNVHFTDCHFGNSGSPGSSLAAVFLSDMAAASSNTNTVHFTACEWESNLWDDLQLHGTTVPAAGVMVVGCKFERGDGAPIRLTNSQGTSIVGNYFFQNINIPACVYINGGKGTSITGNTFAGSSTTLPTYMLDFVTGDYVNVTGNNFLAGANHVRLESGFGTAVVMGNVSDAFGTPAVVSDVRTTKTGMIQQTNGRMHFYDSVGIKMVAGAVTDAAFQATPLDGTIAYDSTNNQLYIRNGTWKKTAAGAIT